MFYRNATDYLEEFNWKFRDPKKSNVSVFSEHAVVITRTFSSPDPTVALKPPDDISNKFQASQQDLDLVSPP
jgi:hypothetical protein